MNTSEFEKTPYANLTPDVVLDAVESLGLMTDGRLLALNSYENRVYQVGIEDAPPIIAKFYRPQRWNDATILEEHAFIQELAASELPVVAPLVLKNCTLHSINGYRFSLTPRRGGRAPDLEQPLVRERLGRFIGRMHAVGARVPFAHRPVLDCANFGERSRDFLLENQWLPPDLVPAYESVAAQALVGVRACYRRAGAVQLRRLHGDIHLGNVLWTDAGPHLIDFDDARTGPAIQDLWMLLAGDRDEMRIQFDDILSGYEDFQNFNSYEVHLIEALRTLRIMHHAAWLAQRWSDPAFPAAFTWFNTQHFWQNHILQLREQVAAMEDEPLWISGN